MNGTILSLTTIPPRFGFISRTLTSILNQSLPFDQIRLYIPRKYRRFPDWNGILPNVPKGVEIYRSDLDYGPATKILPAARDLRGKNVDILFCDDDQFYGRDWHRTLKQAALEHPGTCIVALGANFDDINIRRLIKDRNPRGQRLPKDTLYKLKRILSLGWFRPALNIKAGYIDYFHGIGGVLIKPEWLCDDAYNIPDIIWTVDDIWLSGHFELIGIPIWICEGNNSSHTRARRFNPLRKYQVSSLDSNAAKEVAIAYFRERYGIWNTS